MACTSGCFRHPGRIRLARHEDTSVQDVTPETWRRGGGGEDSNGADWSPQILPRVSFIAPNYKAKPHFLPPAFSRRLAEEPGGARLTLCDAERPALTAAGTIGWRIATNPKTGTSVVAVRANSVGACRCCTARNLRNRGRRHCGRGRSLETSFSKSDKEMTGAADCGDQSGRCADRRDEHRNATLPPLSFTPPKKNSTG